MGLGDLDHAGSKGLKVHSALAATLDGVPLGLVQQAVWARHAAPKGRKPRKRPPQVERESQRWLTSLAEDARGRLLTTLGFKLPDGLSEITGKEFGGNLSMERADLLDVDAIIWLDTKDAKGPLRGPLYESLNVHKQAREVFLDSYNDPLGGATSFVSVLSLPFLLDGLVPQLTAAVDGDPATKATGTTP